MGDTSIFGSLKKGPLKVAVIGGGNWGTTAAKICAENASDSYIFDTEVKLWALEEVYEGASLIHTINTTHVNTRYLPGVELPKNLVACSDIAEAVKDVKLIVFASPHQFLLPLCEQLKGKLLPDAKAISLIKGCLMKDMKPWLCSQVIIDTLGIDCCVLSGANVAKDIARLQFSETTIGYRDRVSAAIWQQLFDRPYFRVNCVPDVHGVELCGCLKNVIALPAGFCDGLGYGTNTKAAIIRIGVEELRLFASLFFDGIIEETFFDSAGYADVITTCWGGRNVRCAKEFVVRDGKSTWEDIEKDLLNGQKLQAPGACEEVYQIIATNNLEESFPLFVSAYKIALGGAPANTLLDAFQSTSVRPMKLEEECNPCILSPAFCRIKSEMGIESGGSTIHSPGRKRA